MVRRTDSKMPEGVSWALALFIPLISTLTLAGKIDLKTHLNSDIEKLKRNDPEK